ncbi:MAG: type 1 glutamine amidotransferase [Deltaproteobacteria bacterium]|nr:type 1 glutamine amidotransferase [Deltaproteobacteria bacterium]
MLNGKRIAILAEEDFEDSELIVPMWGMKNAGAKVLIIGSGSKEIYQGKRGSVAIRVDTTADKVRAEDLDAIIIPGGRAPAKMRKYKSMVNLIKKADELGKIIAAVCHGPQLLAAAGIVKGRRLTSWPSVAAELKDAGAEWVDEAVVRNGNLITSRKPADLPRFNKAIIEALRD